ncbi:MAG TPA: ABC transporter permease [Micromonosporaceae bacterium]|nr:ABC transporter permease [Micromonosporaceae bacterium]
MFAYLKFELTRMVHEPRIMIFTVLMPVASYVVFTGVGSNSGNAEGIPVPATLMIGLAGYGAILGVLSLAISVSVERTQGWLRQLRVTPLRPAAVVAVKVFTSTLIAVPSIVSVGIAAYFQHHVTLSVGEWLLVLVVMWLGTVPFALLGLALGYALPPNLAQPASFLSFFSLSVLGGLLVPAAAFPSALQHFAHALPSNRYAELGWRAVAGHAPTPMGALVLAGWTALFALVAVAAYRRSAATR